MIKAYASISVLVNLIWSMQMTARESEDLAFTILWSPLPPITWLIPFIGHLGIATSEGTACDFQGSYYVSDRGRMAFGEPTRALTINIEELPGKCLPSHT